MPSSSATSYAKTRRGGASAATSRRRLQPSESTSFNVDLRSEDEHWSADEHFSDESSSSPRAGVLGFLGRQAGGVDGGISIWFNAENIFDSMRNFNICW